MHTHVTPINTHAHKWQTDRHTCTQKADRLIHMHIQGKPTDTHAHTRQTDRPTVTHAHKRQAYRTDARTHTQG